MFLSETKTKPQSFSESQFVINSKLTLVSQTFNAAFNLCYNLFLFSSAMPQHQSCINYASQSVYDRTNLQDQMQKSRFLCNSKHHGLSLCFKQIFFKTSKQVVLLCFNIFFLFQAMCLICCSVHKWQFLYSLEQCFC